MENSFPLDFPLFCVSPFFPLRGLIFPSSWDFPLEVATLLQSLDLLILATSLTRTTSGLMSLILYYQSDLLLHEKGLGF